MIIPFVQQWFLDHAQQIPILPDRGRGRDELSKYSAVLS